MQLVRQRIENTVPFLANQTVGVELGRVTLVRELGLWFTGAPTIAAVSNTVANAKRGDFLNVIKAIRLLQNGSDVVREMNGLELFMLNRYLYGCYPRPYLTGNTAGQSAADGISAVSTGNTWGDGATANPFASVQLALPLSIPDTHTPLDTAWHTGLLQSARLEITWGDAIDAFTGLTTAWTVNPQCVVSRLESFDAPNAAGKLQPILPMASSIKPYNFNVSGAVSDFPLDMPLGGLIRGFLINGSTGGVTDLAQGAGITRIKLKSAGQLICDLPWPMLTNYWARRKNRIGQGTTGRGATVNGAFTRPLVSAAFNEDAWGFLDLLSDNIGYLTEAFDTRGLGELKMEVSTNGAVTSFRVCPIQIFPRPTEGSGSN